MDLRGLAGWCAVLVVLAAGRDGRAQTTAEQIDQAADAGEALQKKGDYQGALERFRWCEAESRRGDDEKRLASALQLLGGTERLLGEYPDAEAHYREGLEHALRARDFQREAYILNNLANLFGAQGRYSETISMLREALAINTREGYRVDAAPWQNLAITYALQGDHARALDAFLQALKIYEAAGNTSKLALLHYNLGVLQVKQSNYAAAKRELLEAQTLAQKTGDQIVAAQALGDLGSVQALEGHAAEAEASLRKALELCRQFGHKVCIGENETALGNFYLRGRDTQAAGAAFERARVIFEPLNDVYNLGLALRGLGYVARVRADYKGAAEYAERAGALAKRIGDPEGEWQAEALRGLVARDAGERAVARSAFRNAVGVIEGQRGKVGGAEPEKQRFFEKAVYPYQQLAFLEAEDGRPMEALVAAERAHARVLVDMLAAGPEKVEVRMTDAERAEETRLLAAVAGLNARARRVKAAEADGARRRYEDAWGKYEAFRAGLYVTHPELRTWRGESPVVSGGDLAALVRDRRTAVIEYVCANDRTLLLVVTAGAAGPVISTFPIAIAREELGRRTERFRSMLEKRDPAFRAEAAALYRLLLGPAAGVLRGRGAIDLVADGPLWELPFQALVDPAGKYWVESVALRWTPSLSFLRDRALGQTGPRPAMDLAAFGDPANAGSPAVPLLREQVIRIASLYGAEKRTVLVGEKADEAAFRELAPGARILHLATHGIADRDNAMRSRVLLAAGASGGTGNDGWLEAWELMRLELHAEVAVLSACETGRGTSAEGEGLVGLTWALFAAGVRNVVVSQWRVESESTTALMTGLHRGLRGGADPAEALRGAALALMKDPRYRHPFYWGAFIASGS